MSDSPDPPPPPDYSSLARQQAALNEGAANAQTWANRPNQVNPYGSVTWTNTPTMQRQFDADAYAAALEAQSKAGDQLAMIHAGQTQQALNREDFYRDMPVNQWTQTMTLDPRLQSALDSQFDLQQTLLGRANNVMGQDFDFSSLGLPNIPGLDLSSLSAMPDSGFGAVQEVQDAMMGRLGDSLQMGRDREVQRLKAQGITEGTPAWQAAMQSLNQKDVDANQQALLGAMNAYGDIFNRGLASRQQGLNEQLTQRETSGQDRDRMINEALMQRQMPLNELSALLRAGSGQLPQFENFSQATGYAPADIAGAGQNQYSAAINQYNAQTAQAAQNRSAMSGLLGSAGGLIGSSIGDAAAGAAAGSIWPGVGTLVGGLLGGLLG